MKLTRVILYSIFPLLLASPVYSNTAYSNAEQERSEMIRKLNESIQTLHELKKSENLTLSLTKNLVSDIGKEGLIADSVKYTLGEESKVYKALEKFRELFIFREDENGKIVLKYNHSEREGDKFFIVLSKRW